MAKKQSRLEGKERKQMYEMQYAKIKLNNTYKDNVHNTSDRYKYLPKIRDLYKFNFIMDDTIYVEIDTLTKFKLLIQIDSFICIIIGYVVGIAGNIVDGFRKLYVLLAICLFCAALTQMGQGLSSLISKRAYKDGREVANYH